ncbi:ABC transporter ATP-binding protein [Anaeroarcus burkinensis]|uniref:ABC transporter ATP-binding protein n=1 Tax=Anaeroarcus burkinensis TaxID=82376 RepID=UPI0004060366|nr:ABC transporter ATP-binding protein [Anaeroarcus burkinensis]
MTDLLALRNIVKSYGDDTILQGVSLELQQGSALAIVGDSGGGKTTLLSIMGLLQAPTAGTVLVNGKSVQGLSPQELAQLRGRYFGFVFQRARLINSLSVLENVLVPSRFLRRGESWQKKAIEILERFNLGHRLQHKPQELSLGQLRRVSLARALLLKPPILLADEPTNDLDPALATQVADCLLDARKEGHGIVIVTHDPALAARANKVMRLKHGSIIVEPTALVS